MAKHTPGPWVARDVPGAGLEIHAPVHLVDMAELDEPIMTFQLTRPAGHKLIACERWVQFEPKGWHEMQEANAKLIAAAPQMLEVVEKAIKHRNSLALAADRMEEMGDAEGAAAVRGIIMEAIKAATAESS